MKKIYFFMLSLVLLCTAQDTDTKNGAFFAIGGSYTPQMHYDIESSALKTPLYTGGIKYGARHYFGNMLGLRLYIPIEGGHSNFGDVYNPTNASFASIGMGGDILFDIGSSRLSIGIFAGGEVGYAYYWLDSMHARGVQSNVHLGIALNFNPRFALHLGVKQYINRPQQEKLAISSSISDYGGFVDFVFKLDNGNISREQALRNEIYEKQAKERSLAEEQRISQAQSSSAGSASSGNGFLGAFFGSIIGSIIGNNSSYSRGYYYAPPPLYAPRPPATPRLKNF